MDSSTGSSGSATTEIILMAAKKQAGTGAGWLSWLSLRYVLYMAGLLHAIAFFWACIGAFWHHVFSDMKCDTEIKQVLTNTYIYSIKTDTNSTFYHNFLWYQFTGRDCKRILPVFYIFCRHRCFLLVQNWKLFPFYTWFDTVPFAICGKRNEDL